VAIKLSYSVRYKACIALRLRGVVAKGTVQKAEFSRQSGFWRRRFRVCQGLRDLQFIKEILET
jgi:hypothetical protein